MMETSADIGDPGHHLKPGPADDRQDDDASVNQKHLITDCVQEADEIHARITAVETTMQQFAAHFVRYQEEFHEILGKECLDISKQMQHQKDKLQQSMRDMVRQEISTATKQMAEEISAASNQMRDPIVASDKSTDEALNAKRKEVYSKEDVASALKETQESIVKSINTMTNDMQMGLTLHVTTLESRLALLEMSAADQQNNVTEKSNAASGGFNVSQGRTQQYACEAAGAKGKEEMSVRETASTASASEGSEDGAGSSTGTFRSHEPSAATADAEQAACKAQLDSLSSLIIDVKTELSVQSSAIEQRLVALEAGISAGSQSHLKDIPNVEGSLWDGRIEVAHLLSPEKHGMFRALKGGPEQNEVARLLSSPDKHGMVRTLGGGPEQNPSAEKDQLLLSSKSAGPACEVWTSVVTQKPPGSETPIASLTRAETPIASLTRCTHRFLGSEAPMASQGRPVATRRLPGSETPDLLGRSVPCMPTVSVAEPGSRRGSLHGLQRDRSTGSRRPTPACEGGSVRLTARSVSQASPFVRCRGGSSFSPSREGSETTRAPSQLLLSSPLASPRMNLSMLSHPPPEMRAQRTMIPTAVRAAAMPAPVRIASM